MKIKDFLTFRCMLIPVIVQILFWLSIAVCVVLGIFSMFIHAIWSGLSLIIVGPLLVRLVCEYVIVQFKINDSLREIREEMVSKNIFK
jgi:hypothetical protein